MKLKDKVSVLDENLEGSITKILGDEVFFEDKHGFIHRYSREQLVLVDRSLYNKIPIEIKQEIRKKSSKKHQESLKILDLHFENMVSNPSKYSSFERLSLQKEKLLQSIRDCKRVGCKKLEIIHGIGDGVLQNMVHEVLQGQMGIEYDEPIFFKDSTASVQVYIK